MTEAGTCAEHPRYQVKAFANAESAQHWLAECAEERYRFLSMNSVEATNHFSKELEGLMWIVVERVET